MAGVKLTVTSDIDTRLAELTAALDDRTALFAQINEYPHRAHRERFSKQISPDGKAWQALSPRYAKTKRRNANRILVLRGHLLSWLRGQYDNDNLEFGTNQPYGAIHHFGVTIKRKAGVCVRLDSINTACAGSLACFNPRTCVRRDIKRLG